jgi:Spy/CpxP family protein refolding chaperone
MTDERRIQLIAGTIGVLIVAALTLATAVDAAAQGPPPGRGGRGGPGGFFGDARGRGGFGPLFRLDGLTDAQRQQIRTLADQRREGLSRLAQDVAEARRAFAESVQSGQPDENKADDLGKATAALALGRARLQADIYQVLTAEQKAALARRRTATR